MFDVWNLADAYVFSCLWNQILISNQSLFVVLSFFRNTGKLYESPGGNLVDGLPPVLSIFIFVKFFSENDLSIWRQICLAFCLRQVLLFEYGINLRLYKPIGPKSNEHTDFELWPFFWWKIMKNPQPFLQQLVARSKLSTFVTAGVTRKAFIQL